MTSLISFRDDSFNGPIIYAFAATGRIPLDPDRVLSKRNIRLQSPPLPERPNSQSSLSGSNNSTGILWATEGLEDMCFGVDHWLTEYVI